MVLLLAIAVILPTVCLLWFMTQAVKNERFAVRQKLIDVYTKRAEYFFVELQESYPSDRYIHPLQVQVQSPPYGADPHILFNLATVHTDRCKSLLIYDADGAIEYPILQYEVYEQAGELTAPFQQELKGDFDEAIKQYDAIAEETSDEIIRHKALLAKARCLLKLDREQEATDLVHKLSYPPNPEAIAPELAPIIMRDRVFLARLYARTNDENLYFHLRRILGDSHYNDEKENPFLTAPPAETIIWQLDELITLARQTELSDKLIKEIALAKSRIDAYQTAIEIADIYPDTDLLSDWPDRTIRRISPESKLYGLKFTLANKIILGVSTADKILNVLTAAVNDMQDDTIGVKVYDNFSTCIAGDKHLASKPFLTLVPGKFLPDFRVDVFFRNDSVFKNAAGKQTAIYLWTGMLVAALIVTSGAVAARALEKQMRLNKLKNDFIATVTHELKTPLSSMRVLADTLLQGRYEDRAQAVEYLQLISKENMRLTRLIDNFLTFSRMDRNKQAFDIGKTEPAGIAKAAAEAVQTKFNEENCKFTVTIQDDLPSVSADKDAMVTVLVNLLDNACKYSHDDKQIQLKVFAENDAVYFSVADNGTGMTSRQVKKIFDRFYQADSSLTRRTQGAGLGLAIVKFILDAHNAKITVDSKPDEGSTFTVRLSAPD